MAKIIRVSRYDKYYGKNLNTHYYVFYESGRNVYYDKLPKTANTFMEAATIYEDYIDTIGWRNRHYKL